MDYVNACVAYPVGATVLSKYRLQKLYRIRPVVRFAVVMLLLRRVWDHAPVPLVVRGGYEIRLRVRVRLLEVRKDPEHTSDNDGIVAREPTGDRFRRDRAGCTHQ